MGDEIVGTKKGDTLTGTADADTIRGVGGDDVMSGLEGDDLLDGGDDDDRLVGGKGADQLFGGNGDDYLLGGEGVDRLVGGFGRDTASFETTQLSVAVTLPAGGSATVMIGGVAADTLESCEVVVGGAGDDELIFTDLHPYAGTAAYGGAGDDRLVANYVVGGSGFDTLDLSGVFDSDFGSLRIDDGRGDWDGGAFIEIEAVIGTVLSDRIVSDGSVGQIDGAAVTITSQSCRHRLYTIRFLVASAMTRSASLISRETSMAVMGTIVSTTAATAIGQAPR